MRLRPTGQPESDRLQNVWYDMDGIKVHAWASVAPPPSAPTVILVHGLVISSRYMVPLAERLADAAHVFAPDLPNHGMSGETRRPLSIQGQARSLVRWMDAVGIDRAHFIGNSAGCQVVTALAVRHPERVCRMVLVGPTVDPHHRRFLPQAWRWLINAWREPRPPRLIMFRDFLDVGPRRTVGIIRAVLGDHIERRLPQIVVPTLVVRGSRDPLAPQRWAEEAVRLLPDGTLRVLPGAAHVVNHSSPDELAGLVVPFLGLAEATRAAAGPRHGDG